MNIEILEGVINKQDSSCSPVTEFVGCAKGNTVGLVIANLDSQLRKEMKLDNDCRAVGLVSTRCGGASHIFAADEAVKATNTEVASIQFARDMSGGLGRGVTIVFKSYDVSDARRVVEIMLENVEKYLKNVHTTQAGQIEAHYSARASLALNKAYGAEKGSAFSVIAGGPAAVGIVMSDSAVKTSSVDIVKLIDIDESGYSNQVITALTGDSSAVEQAAITAKEVGINILKSMGEIPKPII